MLIVSVVFVIRCRYCAVSLTLVREQRFIRFIIIINNIKQKARLKTYKRSPLYHTNVRSLLLPLQEPPSFPSTRPGPVFYLTGLASGFQLLVSVLH